jgi:hypothetical protein
MACGDASGYQLVRTERLDAANEDGDHDGRRLSEPRRRGRDRVPVGLVIAIKPQQKRRGVTIASAFASLVPLAISAYFPLLLAPSVAAVALMTSCLTALLYVGALTVGARASPCLELTLESERALAIERPAEIP